MTNLKVVNLLAGAFNLTAIAGVITYAVSAWLAPASVSPTVVAIIVAAITGLAINAPSEFLRKDGAMEIRSVHRKHGLGSISHRHSIGSNTYGMKVKGEVRPILIERDKETGVLRRTDN